MALGIDDRRSDSLRVPPNSVEAEESVLGAVLLDSDAANLALEKLQPDDFYRPSHQAIFDAVVELFNKNEPVDAVTVSEGLRRSDMLERVGGLSYLTQLMDTVPATSNIEHYAAIVEEHALRRKLLRVGGDIGKLATEVDQPINEVVDKAEQAVYAVSEKRVGDGLTSIDPLLGPAIERAEELHRHGQEVTGLSTGLRDLDRKLAGLHPGNLIVIAGRPGMGKSTLAINIAQHVAVSGDPVAIFTLEMSREEVVSRMLCSQGRIDSQRLRTGRLTEGDFSKLSSAANVLYKKPIYVDDSAGLTVTEIRAKSRRLKRRHGLGLVVVDYLQLMHGTVGENRQQEIAIISRSLKNLARELDVPVIGASQLNRSLEQREDKRPRLGDLRECLAAETQIRRRDTGTTVTIAELARSRERDVPVWSLDEDYKLVPGVLAQAWSTGEKPVYKITTTSGRTLRATENHPLRTYSGWRTVGELSSGDMIAVPRRIPHADSMTSFVPRSRRVPQGWHAPAHQLWISGADQQRRFLGEIGVHGARAVNTGDALTALQGRRANTNVDVVPLEVWECVRTAMAARGMTHRQLASALDTSYSGSAMYKSAMSRERLARVAGVVEHEELALLADSDVLWDRIKAIEPDGVAEVFDARVPGTHNFVANDIVVHNSGAIEQDADIVLFIYRNEYYHPEAIETKGIAEVAIAKHRQGSVGRVDLTFLPEFTLFSDMGRDTPVI
jgi:replicative DNA helicase